MKYTPSLGEKVQVNKLNSKQQPFQGYVIAYTEDKDEFLVTCTSEQGFLKVNVDLMDNLMFRDSIVTSKHFYSKYQNQYVCWIAIHNIDEIPEGMSCKICGDWAQWYTANQPDGTFICYACRQDPYRGAF